MLCEDYSSSAFVQVSESNGWICFVHWILDQKKTTNYLYTHNNDPLEPNERITFANDTVYNTVFTADNHFSNARGQRDILVSGCQPQRLCQQGDCPPVSLKSR